MTKNCVDDSFFVLCILGTKLQEYIIDGLVINLKVKTYLAIS